MPGELEGCGLNPLLNNIDNQQEGGNSDANVVLTDSFILVDEQNDSNDNIRISEKPSALTTDLGGSGIIGSATSGSASDDVASLQTLSSNIDIGKTKYNVKNEENHFY